MEPITAVIMIASFFLLRFALPLVCTLGICRLLNKWVERLDRPSEPEPKPA